MNLLLDPKPIQEDASPLSGTVFNVLYAHGMSADDFECEELESRLTQPPTRALLVKCRSTKAQRLYMLDAPLSWRSRLVEDIAAGHFGNAKHRAGCEPSHDFTALA